MTPEKIPGQLYTHRMLKKKKKKRLGGVCDPSDPGCELAPGWGKSGLPAGEGLMRAQLLLIARKKCRGRAGLEREGCKS